MQPRPIAETSRPCRPSFRFSRLLPLPLGPGAPGRGRRGGVGASLNLHLRGGGRRRAGLEAFGLLTQVCHPQSARMAGKERWQGPRRGAPDLFVAGGNHGARHAVVARPSSPLRGLRQHLSGSAAGGSERRGAVRDRSRTLAAMAPGEAVAGPRRRRLGHAGAAPDPVPALLPEPVPVRPLPAVLHPLGLRGGGLPSPDQRRQDERGHPDGHGHPGRPQPCHLLRGIHHPVRRRGLHAGAAAPLQARPAQHGACHRPRLGGLQGGLRPPDRPGHVPGGGHGADGDAVERRRGAAHHGHAGASPAHRRQGLREGERHRRAGGHGPARDLPPARTGSATTACAA